MEKCIFCNIEKERIYFETEFFIGVFDNYPVTEGHVLIISKNHRETYGDLEYKEQLDLIYAINEAILFLDSNGYIDSSDSSGYNVGMNSGKVAGQSIMHFHCHVIPRQLGDTENPKGGVRGVIPNKQDY